MFRPVIVAMSPALCPDDPRCEDTIVRIEAGIRPIETYTLINRNFLMTAFEPLFTYTPRAPCAKAFEILSWYEDSL